MLLIFKFIIYKKKYLHILNIWVIYLFPKYLIFCIYFSKIYVNDITNKKNYMYLCLIKFIFKSM